MSSFQLIPGVGSGILLSGFTWIVRNFYSGGSRGLQAPEKRRGIEAFRPGLLPASHKRPHADPTRSDRLLKRLSIYQESRRVMTNAGSLEVVITEKIVIAITYELEISYI